MLIFGCGGLAAEANHIAAEFVCKYKRVRDPLPAVSLSSDMSIITAIANDFGFEHVFSRQIEALGNGGDIAIGLSTSGNSLSILYGLERAKSMGLYSIDMPRSGSSVSEIQEFQLSCLHRVCEIVETHFYLKQFSFFKHGEGRLSKLKTYIICPSCKERRLVTKQAVLRDDYTGKCLHCFSSRYGENNPLWKGGRLRQPTGYIWLRLSPMDRFFEMAMSQHYVPEHRLVMANKLGRIITKFEHVHHINGIKDDNRPENLELVNATQHNLITKMQSEIDRLGIELKNMKERYESF